MNSASNILEFHLLNGTTLTYQAIHLDAPGSWDCNKEGTTEDYHVFREGKTARLFHVTSRSPYKIEELDLKTPDGSAHWRHIEPHLKV
jgi:hypothetical protein